MTKAYIERDPGDYYKTRVRICFQWVGLNGQGVKVPCVPGKDYHFKRVSCFYFDSVQEAINWCERFDYQAEVSL